MSILLFVGIINLAEGWFFSRNQRVGRKRHLRQQSHQ